jgi:hypothetical protein
LLKTFVTFLIATPSCVCVFVAALRGRGDCQHRKQISSGKGGFKASQPVNIPDNSIGTLSKLLSDNVSLIDNKVLVEDLEGLSLLEVHHGCEGDERERESNEREQRERATLGSNESLYKPTSKCLEFENGNSNVRTSCVCEIVSSVL